MFAELLRQPGVEEQLVLRSRVGLLAFHGGSLEQRTDDIAREVATSAGASLYAVVQPPQLRWHVPSKLVDPAASPALAELLDHIDLAIAIHGFGRAGLFTSVLVGGSNRDLAALVASSVRARLDGYEVVDELDAIPVELRGLHPDNPVNRPRLGGVQLELPPRVRGLGPYWQGHDPAAPVPHTSALIAGLVDAIAAVGPALEAADAS